MALSASEAYGGGWVRDVASGTLVVTFVTAGASVVAGHLRDPDGRLVVRR